jgi:hypothetical protein
MDGTTQRSASFDKWLTRYQEGDVDIDAARAGFDAGWAAAREERAWFRTMLTNLRATAAEGRRSGRWADPLDRIINHCEQGLLHLEMTA